MIAVPNVLLDCGSRHDLAKPLHHDGQQASFARRQVYSLATAEDFSRGCIECELPGIDAQRAHLDRPAQQRPNACKKLRVVEWLYETVICAAIEGGDAVGDACPSRNDQDRPIVGGRSGVADQLHAIAVGQPQVDHVDVVGRDGCRVRELTGGGHEINRVALVA
jgi:hypothetical protein